MLNVEPERTAYWLLTNGSGIYKNYQAEGHAPDWIRITHYDRQTHIVEGQFALHLSANKQMPVSADRTAPSAHFHQGLFRVRLIDVPLK